MKIKWDIDDGRLRRAGLPRYEIDVDDGDLADCESMEERIKLVDAFIEEAMRQTIMADWDHDQLNVGAAAAPERDEK